VPRMRSTLTKSPNQYPGFGILFLAWTLLGSIAYVHYSLVSGSWGKAVLPELANSLFCYYPWLFLTPQVFRLERRYPIGKSQFAAHSSVLALAGLAFAYIAGEFAYSFNLAAERVFRVRMMSSHHTWWVLPSREVALQYLLYSTAVAGACLIRNAITLREKERLAVQLTLEKEQLENSLHQAELETLRMRLNPHFLFNCLQNISTLAQQEPQTASRMLTRLGDLLRAALRPDSEAESTLQSELGLTQDYVAIEKMRFADRLSVLLDIAPETEMALVPSFVLQPLVENAVRHGLRSEQKLGVIWIRSSRDDAQLALAVSDNGIGISEEELGQSRKGIGLYSTSERLKRMYPDRHTFSIRRLPEGGTEVRITMPLRFKEVVGQTCTHESSRPVDR